METKTINYIHVWLSLAAYVACFFQPAFYSGDTADSVALLLIGWLGPLDSHFSWYANIFYFVSLCKYEKLENSIVYGFIALFLALSFLAYSNVANGSGASSTKIIGYGLGYYLWVLAIFIYCIGQLVRYKYTKTTNKAI